MIDLALLRILKYREQFHKVYRYIPMSSIDKKTKAVTEDIRKYFDLNEDQDVLDFPAFRSMFFTTFHPSMDKEKCVFFNQLLDRMEKDVPDSVKNNIINQLLALEFATDVANAIEEYQGGEEIDIVDTIHNMTEKVRNSKEKSSGFVYAGFKDSTVNDDMDDSGYTWPLDMMNMFYRNILGGDQYIVAARPGKGKTSFLTWLNAHLAKQTPDNKIHVWFNNESRRQRIMSRQIQSALNKTNKELSVMNTSGTMQQAYIDAVGGLNKIRIYDVHGMHTYQLEDILEEIGTDNIGLIIGDMLDNVKYNTKKELREDQRLEQMYQWFRELGVKYNCPTFPTSQISVDGDGLLFPSESMLKDSKTGKQGATDSIIMLGCSNDPLLQNTRGLSMPKTKMKRPGQSDMREEVLFDADRGRFIYNAQR